MRYLHSYYQIVKFPLIVLMFAGFLCGISNIILNPAYGLTAVVANNWVFLVGEFAALLGKTVLNYTPFLFLLRLLTQKNYSSVTIVAGLIGYITFHAVTIFVPTTLLPSYAYSAVFGLGIGASSIGYLSGAAHYPLLTGMAGMIIVTYLTYIACMPNHKNTRVHTLRRKQTGALIRTVLYCLLAGVLFAIVWPYIILFIQRLMNYIAADLSSPLNMMIYGVADRLLQTFHLGTLIRQPLWYTAAGGSWTNIAGNTIVGDANIWTAQISVNTISSMTGRFFAPYYIMNIFAVPAMIAGMYMTGSSRKIRSKMKYIAIISILISWLSGTTIPLQIMLLLLCPLLYVFHIIYNGFLYGLFTTLHIYLGYRTVETNTVAAMPGTLPEFLSYLQYPNLYRTMLLIVVVGVLSAIAYYAATRLYFQYFASEMIMPEAGERKALRIIRYAGGQENIKQVESDMNALSITVYDKETVDMQGLKDLGSLYIEQTDNEYRMLYGAKSTMLRKEILDSLRTIDFDGKETVLRK